MKTGTPCICNAHEIIRPRDSQSNTTQHNATHPRVSLCLRLNSIEPTTFCILDRCSTNWATKAAQQAGSNHTYKATKLKAKCLNLKIRWTQTSIEKNVTALASNICLECRRFFSLAPEAAHFSLSFVSCIVLPWDLGLMYIYYVYSRRYGISAHNMVPYVDAPHGLQYRELWRSKQVYGVRHTYPLTLYWSNPWRWAGVR